MKIPAFKRSHLSVAAGALLLVACGGNGGSGDGDPLISGTNVPTSATTSAEGAFNFINSVAASSDDSAEPLLVNDVTLATSETDEPDPKI